MRIFVCGPLSAPLPSTRALNVARALSASVELIRRGHEPFCPHAGHYMDIVAAGNGMPISYDRWMRWCAAWLPLCHAILFLGPSPGADRELAQALDLGLLIYDRVEDVPDASI